jgi:hypothetical protein
MIAGFLGEKGDREARGKVINRNMSHPKGILERRIVLEITGMPKTGP